MGLIWLALAAIAVWALVRLGRQSETPRRGHWRIAATLLGAVLLAGGVLAASHGAWFATIGMAGAGFYLIVTSRVRPTKVIVRPANGMTDAEARSILGIPEGASPEVINAAWRRLMGCAHPDQGGTEGLASRLNAARDRLLKR